MGFSLRRDFDDVAGRRFDQGGFDPRLDGGDIKRGPDASPVGGPRPITPQPLTIDTPQSVGDRMDQNASNATTNISNYYIELRTRALDAGRPDIVERLDTVWKNFGLKDEPAPGSSPDAISNGFTPQARTLMTAMDTIADEAGLRGPQPGGTDMKAVSKDIMAGLDELDGTAGKLREMQTPKPDLQASNKYTPPAPGVSLV